MVFHGREPIKKCYAEFENYVSLADTNFVKTRGKIVKKIEEKVEILKALEYSKSCWNLKKKLLKVLKLF